MQSHTIFTDHIQGGNVSKPQLKYTCGFIWYETQQGINTQFCHAPGSRAALEAWESESKIFILF